jgi:chemotaxis protein methyltransferase CheR
MGPEPYSLAIILRENMGSFCFRNVTIHATDIDHDGRFGEMIATGLYPWERVKRMPEEVLGQYFTAVNNGAEYHVEPELMDVVRYRRHDLLSLEPIRTGFGLIVCKNVLLHFTPDQRRRVVQMFHSALAPGGFLAFEQTQDLVPGTTSLFERVRPDAQLFRRR